MTKEKEKLALTESGNGNEGLSNKQDLIEVAENISSERGLSKTLKYYLYRCFKLDTTEACKLAGIKKSYGYQLNTDFNRKPIVRERLTEILNPDMQPDIYRDFCKMALLDIAEIESKAMQEYKRKPKLAIDKPQLLKHMKQGAGLLLTEEAPMKVGAINVDAIQVYIENRHKELSEGAAPRVGNRIIKTQKELEEGESNMPFTVNDSKEQNGEVE